MELAASLISFWVVEFPVDVRRWLYLGALFLLLFLDISCLFERRCTGAGEFTCTEKPAGWAVTTRPSRHRAATPHLDLFGYRRRNACPLIPISASGLHCNKNNPGIETTPIAMRPAIARAWQLGRTAIKVHNTKAHFTACSGHTSQSYRT